MHYYKPLYILLFSLFVSAFSYSQKGYIVKNKKGYDKINFKLVNNVIIIPIEVNGIELSFLLDTGVNKPIVFNFLKNSDSLSILNSEKIYLKGLGNNELIEALKSSNNTFKIGDAVNNNQDFYVIFDSSINFVPQLGVPIHGIIGYDFFKDLIIEVNYPRKQLRIYNPENYNYKSCKKCEQFNLQFYNNKPYFEIVTKINNKEIPVKLLLDSGNSDSLWLFSNDTLGISINNNHFDDFLGFGLSGSIHGKRSKINEVNLKSFRLKTPKVAYPDEEYITIIKKIRGRNGSIGGEILKRFNIIYDYKKAKIILKKNSFFKNAFSYNKSGIELIHDGIRIITELDQGYNIPDSRQSNSINVQAVYSVNNRYIIKPAYSISSIRKGSPADIIGLKKGDLLISINGKDTKNYKLQQLIDKFYDDEGKRIKLNIEREGKPLRFTFYLKSPLN